jgi:hypothetical protein
MWIALPEHPIGGSSNVQMWNRLTPLGSFEGNEVHSCGNDGLHVDTGPKPDNSLETVNYQPCVHDTTTGAWVANEAVRSTIKGFKAWRVRNGGVSVGEELFVVSCFDCLCQIWCRCSIDVETSQLADCPIGMTFATNNDKLDYPTTMRSSKMLMRVAANFGESYSWQLTGEGGRSISQLESQDLVWGGPKFPVRGFQYYDGPSQVLNSDFYDYVDNAVHASGAQSVLFRDRFDVGRMNTGKGVRYFNSKPFHFPIDDNYGK